MTVLPKDLEASVLPKEATVRDALRTLNEGGVQVALDCSSDGVLRGILTDGNVRRALLNGASLHSPIAQFLTRDFIRVSEREGRAEALDLMQSLGIKQLPVVNDAGQLRGLHLLNTLISPTRLPNDAVILAGGKGLRLRPITEHVPKPMLRVAGRPILERLVLHLSGHGVRKIYLAVNYKGHLVEEHFGDGKRFGCQIEYIRETEPLGTAGALSLLPEPPTDHLLVLNGDLVTQFDVSAMLRAHCDQDNALTLGVKLYLHQIPYGCVTIEGGMVRELQEKPTVSKAINAGIYVVNPEFLARLRAGQAYQMTEFVADLIERGDRVGVFELHDDWIDIGLKESLSLAREGV